MLKIVIVILSFLILCLNSKKRITFLGSSIVQQKEGFVPALKNHYSEFFDFEGYGFGGIGINPCRLDLAFSNKPDIIVYGWQYGSNVEKFIKVAIMRAKIEMATPVYIIFPHITSRDDSKINIIKNLSQELNFSVINLRDDFTREELKSGILRDPCHTTPFGSVKYAEKIFEFFNQTELKTPVNITDVDMDLAFPKRKMIAKESFNSTELDWTGEIIGIFNYIGRHSNYIQIYVNEILMEKKLMFDSWCYFERLGYLDTSNFGKNINGTMAIRIMNETFDRKMDFRQIDWDSIRPKFHPVEVCYTGDLHKIKIDGETIFE